MSATVKIKHKNDNKMDIIYSGELRHKGGVHHCRRIKRSQREKIKVALDGSDPSRVESVCCEYHSELGSIAGAVYKGGSGHVS